jgi:hypothetical protein
LELEENDFVVVSKEGFDSKVILYIEGENYYSDYQIDIGRYIGENMVGRIVISDSKISGEELSHEVEFEGIITGVYVILLLEEKPTDSEFEEWIKRNYVKIKY